MSKIKVAELTGAALDWAVAKAEGYVEDSDSWLHEATVEDVRESDSWHPSVNWAQGGPIIERIRGFELKVWLESKFDSKCEAHIHNYGGNWIAFGPTPLIAAMRCYVDAKLGDEIDVKESVE